MGAVAFGALMLAVLLVIVAAFVWQSARRAPQYEHSEYFVPEATEFVFDRLSDRALSRLEPGDVRRILEWNLHFTQVIAPRRSDEAPVIGSGEGMEYVLERAVEHGVTLEPIDVAEVMAIEPDYLLSIGALGGPVEEGSP